MRKIANCSGLVCSSASTRNCAPEKSRNQALCFSQRLIQFARVLAAAARVVGLAAAFAAHDRRNLLNNFARLNFRCELRRDRRHQRHALAMATAKHNHPFEAALQRIGHSLEKIAIGGAEVVDDYRHAIDGLDFFE